MPKSRATYNFEVGLLLRGHTINLEDYTENKISALRTALRKEMKEKNIKNKRLRCTNTAGFGYVAKLVSTEKTYVS